MRLKSSVYDFIDENDPVCFDDKNHSGRHYRMRISMSTHQGGRKYMEDEYSIVHYQAPQPCEDRNKSDLSLKKSFMFFGVFDGHGGDMAARFSRKHLCRNIVRQKMFWSDNDDEVCLAIHKGFLRTQKEMLKELGNFILRFCIEMFRLFQFLSLRKVLGLRRPMVYLQQPALPHRSYF